MTGTFIFLKKGNRRNKTKKVCQQMHKFTKPWLDVTYSIH